MIKYNTIKFKRISYNTISYQIISIIILYHHKLLRESTCCSRTSCSRPRPSLVSLCRACGRSCGGWLVPPWLFRSSYWASFGVDPPPQGHCGGSCSGCWLCAVAVCLPASSKLTWYFCGFLWSGLFWFSCFIYTHTHVYMSKPQNLAGRITFAGIGVPIANRDWNSTKVGISILFGGLVGSTTHQFRTWTRDLEIF